MDYKKLLKASFFSLLAVVGVLGLHYGLRLVSSQIFSSSPVNFGTVLILLVEILIIKKVGNADVLKNKKFWYGVYLASTVLVFHTIVSSMSVISGLNDGYSFKPINKILLIVAQMLIGAGVYEEFLFRGIVFNIFDRYLGHKSPKTVWCTVIFSGVIFGFYHFVNWVQGGALRPVLLQIVATTGFGIFFGAIYMRNRNLWSLAFIHGVYDVMQLGTSAIFNITEPNIVHSDRGANVNIINVIPYIVQMFAYVFISIFLLRKKKMKEIIDSDKLESNLKY